MKGGSKRKARVRKKERGGEGREAGKRLSDERPKQ